VRREDIDAVVRSVVENEAPYPLALPGGHSGLPDHLSGMPFKPAASQPPPPMVPQTLASHPTPAHGIPLRADDGHVAPASAAKSQSPPRPVERKARVIPVSRESYSDPYVAIESEDTFSSTAEVAAAQMPPSVEPEPTPVSKDAEAEGRNLGRSPRKPAILDEPSFDEVLTSIHKRTT